MSLFSKQDQAAIEAHRLSLREVEAQVDRLLRPPTHVRVLRPCTVGDGIRVIAADEADALIGRYEAEARKGRCMKFVPASGAASRMFKDLLACLHRTDTPRYDTLVREAAAGDKSARACTALFEGLERLAFANDLKQALREQGHDFYVLKSQGNIAPLLRCLLFEPGLDYASRPKGLLKFHDYGGEGRTAFEEHLVEAAGYVADAQGVCAVHFTVSEEHLAGFEALLRLAAPLYEKALRVSYRIGFSVQKPSTDTIALDFDGRPFRQADGRLLFRPAGHGALIENLNDLRGDILFIKNIDNVVPDRLKPGVVRWKKVLGGLLVSLQERVFNYLDALEITPARPSLVPEVIRFMEHELSIALPERAGAMDPEALRDYLAARLNRPIRVCGMVRNVGEPGGGPFWVAEKTGDTSLQIVELSQTDAGSPEQQALLSKATHFNPVDLVCAVQDREGRPFDLHDFVDHDAVFILKKSKDGRDLKALELPGLWNGAMARWITVFAEVPTATFAPVKTVNDLLRPEHQQALES